MKLQQTALNLNRVLAADNYQKYTLNFADKLYKQPELTQSQRGGGDDEFAMIVQFLRFGTVGTCGFFIDTAVVYALVSTLGLYGAGMVSYLVAASSCWTLNRIWTFRGRGGGPAYHQWAKYLTMNLVGFLINRGTYVMLVTAVPLCAAQPVFAVAAGALAGMMVNFTLLRQVVFR